MSERYSEGDEDDATIRPPADDAEWTQLLARLLPGVDVDLVVRALRDELAPPPGVVAGAPLPTSLPPAARELHRVRAALALGTSASMLQHSINNPLTALLAEAQLLELEPLTEEQRVSVVRIIELARRVAGVVRQLDRGGAPPGP